MTLPHRRIQGGRAGLLLSSASGRSAIDANPFNVHVRVLLCGRLHPEDPVRKTGILDVLPRNIMELLRPVGSPHSVNLHHNETELGK